MIVFPSDYFVLLLEPSVVGSPRRRRRISLSPMTFSSQFFSDRKPQNPRCTRPIYTSEETLSENSSPRTAMCRFSPAALPSMRRRVWARGPLSGDEILYPGSSGGVLLTHPSDGPPRALLIHLFTHFSSAALCQPLFSTIWVT